MSFIELVRENKLITIFDQDYDSNWSDIELCTRIIEVDCIDCNLTYIPNLPNCVALYCSYNQLKKLPELPKCEVLGCSNNLLTELPDLPNCLRLGCSNNPLIFLPELPKCYRLSCMNCKLKKLPSLPNCETLCCEYNQLTFLPYLPKCSIISYNNNISFLFDDVLCYTKLKQFQKFYLGLKFIRLMYKKMLIIKSYRLMDLHNELKFSPDLPFYKNDEYYQHFIKLKNKM